MRILVVYYSLQGNTKLIAERIATAINADIVRLKPNEEPSSKGFMKFVWGGRQVVRKIEPELEPLKLDPGSYKLVLIGTPVWAGTYAPALRSFFKQHKLKGKKIALFCCHGGGKGKVFQKMTAAIPGNDILGQADFIEPLRKDTEANVERADTWARNLLTELESASTDSVQA